MERTIADLGAALAAAQKKGTKVNEGIDGGTSSFGAGYETKEKLASLEDELDTTKTHLEMERQRVRTK